MSRGKIALAVVIFFSLAALFAHYLIQDLGIARVGSGVRLPDIVVERLDFARVIKGREWRVRADGAESESGVIRARSLDVDVREISSGRSARLSAASGEYATENYKMWLREVRGVADVGDRSVDFAAPMADYDASADAWFFSGGVSASDDRIFVTGGLGRIDPNGVLSLGKGVRVRWRTD